MCIIPIVMRYVYVIGNLVNWKVYVGQTINPSRRKAGHFTYARKDVEHPLYRSIRKHGEQNFQFIVLEECTDALIDEREKFWIAHFDSQSRERGYNLAPGGRSTSTEHHRKLSEALKGNKHCVGRKVDDETRHLLKQGWKTHNARRHGKKVMVTEVRTCRCGTQFEVTYASNRKYHVKQFCSLQCANARFKRNEVVV